MENNLDLVKKEVESLFEKIGLPTTAEVLENEGAFQVTVNTEDNALVIGKHGNTLMALEHVIMLILVNKTGEFKRVTLEIGGYRQEREEYLKELSDRLKQEVIETGMEKSIRGLKPWERRLVHMTLSEDDSVTTESTGEDRDRVLVIKKK